MGAACCASEEPEGEHIGVSYASDAVALMENLENQPSTSRQNQILNQKYASYQRHMAKASVLDAESCSQQRQRAKPSELESERFSSWQRHMVKPREVEAAYCLESPADAITKRAFEPSQSEHDMFFVSVDVTDEGHGLELDLTDMDSVLVDSVSDGAILKWNMDHPNLTVRPLDRIIVVNGVRGKASMLNSVMSSCINLNMVIVRPKLFSVHASKLQGNGGRESLGLEMTFCRGCATLMVCAVIQGGVIARWNKRFPQYSVRPGDRIVKVDDFKGFASLLKEQMLCLEQLTITVMAPQAEETPGIRIDFEVGENMYASRVFTQSPMGLGISRKSDGAGDRLMVSEISVGHIADAMGVKVGWIFVAIAGISLCGLAYEKQEAMFHDLTSILAHKRSWYF